MALFSGVGTTEGAGAWLQQSNGAIRTIRPDMATVIQCVGAVDDTQTPIDLDDGLIKVGGTAGLSTAVDLNKFEFVSISFTEADLQALGVSNADGKASFYALINALPVATKLFLVGFSEGAAILSDVYDEIRFGILVSRISHLLGGVMFGNPRRGTGVTFTDPTFGLCPDPIPGGSGIASNPLTATGATWWEMALAGDPVTCQINTADNTNPAYWARQFYIAAETGTSFQTVINTAFALGFTQYNAALTAANTLLNLATSQHNDYDTVIPFSGLGDTRDYFQIGVDHINSFAAGVSVPAGQAHRLEGEKQSVTPGQIINAGADVMWYNFPVFSGDAITVSVDVFDFEDVLIDNVVGASATVSNPVNNSPYQSVSMTFTLPDDAFSARLVYEVAAQVMTTGIVRFNDPVFIASGGRSGPRLERQLELEDQFLHGDNLMTRAMAGDALAEFKNFYDKTWVIRIWDMLWRPVGELGDDLMELTGTQSRNKVSTASIKIKGDSQYVDRFMSCKDTLVGITLETAGLRLAFYVDVFDWEYTNGEWTGTAHCLGIWDVLNYMQVWPNFLLPIQAQIPSHAVFIWGMLSVITLMVTECAFRLQTGLWEFFNNALSLNPDTRAWFGTLLQSNGNIFDMLKTPVYVSPQNPFLDTSPLVARTVRFESCGVVIADITRAYGVDVTVDLWLPGDEQPDEWTSSISILTLTQPTYVVKAKDRSQIEGPTKTFFDLALRTGIDFLGSFFGDISPLITTVPGMEGVFESPLLGVNFIPPWAVIIAPDHGEKGSVTTCKLSFHTPKGWQHIIGGRSPKWLNDLFNAFFSWILDSISILVGLVGIPSDLISGLFNNAFLAFQLMEHYGRRNQVGPYHPCMEVMHPTSSAPYNIETIFGFINAYWDSRGYMSGQFTFRDGEVYKLGKDIFVGGLVSLVFQGRKKLYTEYIEHVMFTFSPVARDVMIQVGDGRAEESPLAKHQRFITAEIEALNVLTLSPQS